MPRSGLNMVIGTGPLCITPSMDRIVDVSICCIMSCMSADMTDDTDDAEEVPDDLSLIFTSAPNVYTTAGPILGSTRGNLWKTAS